MKRTHGNYHIYHNESIRINKSICNARDIRELINIYDENKLNFNAVNISTIINRFAKLFRGNEKNFIIELIPSIMDHAQNFKPQEISNLAWSFAKINVRNIELFELLAEETKYKIKKFNSQNITNLAWSFATLNITNVGVLELLAEETKYKIKNFNSQNITNLAWSFATQNINNIELFELLAEETKHKIKNFKSQEISNLAWSFATLNIRNVELFGLLAGETKYKIKNFNSQEISNLTWSFATLYIRNKELFELLAEETKYKIKNFNSQDIANLAWSFATLNVIDKELFGLLTEETKYRIKDFNAQDISNLAWSFAILNMKNIELFDILAKESIFKIKDFNYQEIANLAWSFAILDDRNTELLELLIKTYKGHNLQQLRQLQQVYLHCKYELRSDRLINLFSRFDFNEIKNNDIYSSSFHLDCVLHLQLLKIDHQNEINVEGLYCDIYLPDQNIIIEVNGPTHYTHLDVEPLGRTVFKTRILRAMGYTVKTIPWWDWDDMDNSEEKKSYLLKLIR